MAANNRLTWKDTQAPDFGTAGQLAKNAATMIQQAIGGVGAGLDSFDDFRKQQASDYLARQAAQFTDPNELQAALANGSLYGGADPSKFSAGDLNKMNSRVSSLLDQENSRIFTLNSKNSGERLQADYEEKVADRDWMNKNSEQINTARLMASRGNVNGANQIISQLEGINPRLFNSISGSNLGFASDSNKLATDIHKSDDLYFKDGQTRNQFLATQEAGRMFTDLVRNGGLDNTDGNAANRANTILNNISDPNLREAFSKQLAGAYPDMFTPLTQQVTTPAGKFSTSIPPNQISSAVGNAIFQQESGGGKAKTDFVNSSNVTGPMQIMESTFNGMKKDGLIPDSYDWKNPEHNKDAGFKLVDSYAKKYNNDPEKIAAAYYGGPGAVNSDGTINRQWRDKKNPKAPTVGEYVDQVVGRMNKTNNVATASNIATPSISADQFRNASELNAVKDNVAVASMDDMGLRLLEAGKRNEELRKTGANSVSNIANEVTKEDGPLSGMDKGKFADYVRQVQSKIPGISPVGATELLKEVTTQERDTVWGIPNVLSGKRVTAVDESALGKLLDQYANGKYASIMHNQGFVQQGRNSANRDMEEWRKANETKKAELTKYAAHPRANPDVLAQMQSDIVKSEQGYNAALGSASTIQNGMTGAMPQNGAVAAIANVAAQNTPVPIDSKPAAPTPKFEPAAKYGENKPGVSQADKPPTEKAKASAQAQIDKLQQELDSIKSSDALNDGVKMLQSQVKMKAIQRLKDEFKLS